VTIDEALEQIYDSLEKDNLEIDARIEALKMALKAQNTAEIVMNPLRLAQNNRHGRKLLVAYFRQRGVKVSFD
jgi:frataxin-like iron-binding protein CyaY